MANSLSWQGFTTSCRLSHVMYLCTMAANSCHHYIRAVGGTPFPFCTNCSSGYLKIVTASCKRTCLSVHLVPSTGIPVTSAMISSETIMFLPLTIVWPFWKFCRNSSVISSWNPYNLVKYFKQPACSRIVEAWFDTLNTVGSFWMAFPPMAVVFLWLVHLHALLSLFHDLEQQQRTLNLLTGEWCCFEN